MFVERFAANRQGGIINHLFPKWKQLMIKKQNIKKARTAHLRVGAVSCWVFYSVAGLGWFRLFGVGLHWKDTSRHRMYFSERNGYKKALKIGSWRISFLPCS
jgi:hypothetical protein